MSMMFVVSQDRILDYYESYRRLEVCFYSVGVHIELTQKQVVKSENDVKDSFNLINIGLTMSETIELRDALTTMYPIEEK